MGVDSEPQLKGRMTIRRGEASNTAVRSHRQKPQTMRAFVRGPCPATNPQRRKPAGTLAVRVRLGGALPKSDVFSRGRVYPARPVNVVLSGLYVARMESDGHFLGLRPLYEVNQSLVEPWEIRHQPSDRMTASRWSTARRRRAISARSSAASSCASRAIVTAALASVDI